MEGPMINIPLEAQETLRLQGFQNMWKAPHANVNHNGEFYVAETDRSVAQRNSEIISQAPSSEYYDSSIAKRWSLLHQPENLFEIDADKLKLTVLLNESGIGQVWIGELTEPSGMRRVAVKQYPSAFAEEELTMFRREVGVLFMAASRCHNVCKVYGTTVKNKKMCIVMKLYKESMSDLIRRQPGGCLPLHEVRRYGAEICKAVAELHEQSIIIQDLKPPNILLDDYDHCVVADFGISKIVQGAIGVHMPSNVQGTFNYMSPEAFDPEQFGGVTFSADAWSFGCTLIEMITGIKPWDGIKMAPIVRKVMNREVPDIPKQIPPCLDRMLRQCFAFNPAERPTFSHMYGIFRSEWTEPDILKPLTGLLGSFWVQGQERRDAADGVISNSEVQVIRNESIAEREGMRAESQALRRELANTQVEVEKLKSEAGNKEKSLRAEIELLRQALRTAQSAQMDLKEQGRALHTELERSRQDLQAERARQAILAEEFQARQQSAIREALEHARQEWERDAHKNLDAVKLQCTRMWDDERQSLQKQVDFLTGELKGERHQVKVLNVALEEMQLALRDDKSRSNEQQRRAQAELEEQSGAAAYENRRLEAHVRALEEKHEWERQRMQAAADEERMAMERRIDSLRRDFTLALEKERRRGTAGHKASATLRGAAGGDATSSEAAAELWELHESALRRGDGGTTNGSVSECGSVSVTSVTSNELEPSEDLDEDVSRMLEHLGTPSPPHMDVHAVGDDDSRFLDTRHVHTFRLPHAPATAFAVAETPNIAVIGHHGDSGSPGPEELPPPASHTPPPAYEMASASLSPRLPVPLSTTPPSAMSLLGHGKFVLPGHGGALLSIQPSSTEGRSDDPAASSHRQSDVSHGSIPNLAAAGPVSRAPRLSTVPAGVALFLPHPAPAAPAERVGNSPGGSQAVVWERWDNTESVPGSLGVQAHVEGGGLGEHEARGRTEAGSGDKDAGFWRRGQDAVGESSRGAGSSAM